MSKIISTTNDIKGKGEIPKDNTKDAISTRNVIPSGRELKKQDIDDFIKKNLKKGIKNGNTTKDE